MRNKIIYIALLALVILLGAALEIYTSACGPLSDAVALSPQTEYAVNYALLLLSLAGVFFAIRGKGLSPLPRMCMVAVPALADTVYYYLRYDANVLWCLPVLFVAYLFVWPKEEGGQE